MNYTIENFLTTFLINYIPMLFIIGFVYVAIRLLTPNKDTLSEIAYEKIEKQQIFIKRMLIGGLIVGFLISLYSALIPITRTSYTDEEKQHTQNVIDYDKQAKAAQAKTVSPDTLQSKSPEIKSNIDKIKESTKSYHDGE